MKNYLTKILLFTLLGLCLQGNAQEVKTNEEGDQIVVYPDGTWRYLEPGEIIPTPPSASGEEEKLSPKDKEEAFNARIEALRLAEKKQSIVAKMEIKYTEASQNYAQLGAQLKSLRQQGITNPEQQEILELKVLKAKEKEKETAAELKKAQKEAEFYKDLVYMTQKKREKLQLKYEAEKAEKEREAALLVTASSREVNDDKKTDKPKSNSQRTYAKYSPGKDVILNPPPAPCKIAIDETDEFTGKRRRTTETELLFTYTRDEIRPYYKGKEHTVCHANITSMTGGIYVLSIEIAIASRTAQQEYGGLLSNGTILVVLLDGSTITMINNRTDRGRYDAVRDVYLFKGNYQIPPKQVKELIDGEVDKIRVVWEQGYDTYDIYQLDFLSNHLKCLTEGS